MFSRVPYVELLSNRSKTLLRLQTEVRLPEVPLGEQGSGRYECSKFSLPLKSLFSDGYLFSKRLFHSFLEL